MEQSSAHPSEIAPIPALELQFLVNPDNPSDMTIARFGDTSELPHDVFDSLVGDAAIEFIQDRLENFNQTDVDLIALGDNLQYLAIAEAFNVDVNRSTLTAIKEIAEIIVMDVVSGVTERLLGAAEGLAYGVSLNTELHKEVDRRIAKFFQDGLFGVSLSNDYIIEHLALKSIQDDDNPTKEVAVARGILMTIEAHQKPRED